MSGGYADTSVEPREKRIKSKRVMVDYGFALPTLRRKSSHVAVVRVNDAKNVILTQYSHWHSILRSHDNSVITTSSYFCRRSDARGSCIRANKSATRL
jgi:hypothetical protein